MGDVVRMPSIIPSDSVAHGPVVEDNLYGRPQGHPLLVLRVHDNGLAECLMMTAFSSKKPGQSFREKCHTNAWASRYVPLDRSFHPALSPVKTSQGAMGKDTYINVENPLTIEWAVLERWGKSDVTARVDKEGMTRLPQLVEEYARQNPSQRQSRRPASSRTGSQSEAQRLSRNDSANCVHLVSATTKRPLSPPVLPCAKRVAGPVLTPRATNTTYVKDNKAVRMQGCWRST